MKIGDMVKMNGKYAVSDNNRDKVFVVRSRPFEICGTECVLLRGYSGRYAVEGLTIVENSDQDTALQYPDCQDCTGKVEKH